MRISWKRLERPAASKYKPLGYERKFQLTWLSYAEAAHLVYTHNIFMMHSLGALFRFVEIVPASRLGLIKSIYVSTDVNGANFTRAEYGTQGMQKISRDLAPLFMFNWFDNGEHQKEESADEEAIENEHPEMQASRDFLSTASTQGTQLVQA